MKTILTLATSILICACALHAQTIQALIDSARPGSTIHLPPGVHQENLKLWKDLTLVGNDQVFLQSNPYEEYPAIAVTIHSNVNVRLRHLTVQKSTSFFGALWNQGRARIENCSFIRNGNDDTAGAIYNEGVLTVYRCVLSNNLAYGEGGCINNKGRITVIESQISHSGLYPQGSFGIYNNGYLHLLRSTIYANGSGGIRNRGTALIEHSTIAPNFVYPFGQYGIEIDNFGKMFLRHCTIVSGPSFGCFLSCGYRYIGVRNRPAQTNFFTGVFEPGRLYASHTILDTRHDYEPGTTDYFGPPISMIGELISLGHNLISNTNGFNSNLPYFTIPGSPTGTVFALIHKRSTDIVGPDLDPLLGPFQDNGGPTLTYALLPGSPAINAGHNRKRELDQRGVKRDKHPDIGAYEAVRKKSKKKSK